MLSLGVGEAFGFLNTGNGMIFRSNALPLRLVVWGVGWIVGRSIRVFVILMPALGIFQDVLSDIFVSAIGPDNMFVIVALPNCFSIAANPIDAPGGSGFKILDDRPDRTR